MKKLIFIFCILGIFAVGCVEAEIVVDENGDDSIKSHIAVDGVNQNVNSSTDAKNDGDLSDVVNEKTYKESVNKAFKDARETAIRPEGALKVVCTPAEASCFSCELQYENGVKEILPEMVNVALECPVSAPILSKSLYDLYYWEDFQLKDYNFDTGEVHSLMSLLPSSDGVSWFSWSPDGTKLAFVAVNQEDYKNLTKLFVLNFDENDGHYIDKQKYDIKVNFLCGSVCSPLESEDFLFEDNNTIKYRTWNEVTYDLEGDEAVRKIKI